MAEREPKNKRNISAKSLANLRPNPQHLQHKGGSRAREYATNQEIEVLNNLLDSPNHRDAARRAGLPKGFNVGRMLLRPVIAQTFAELQAKRLNESAEAAERRREERSQFGHDELIHRLRIAKTHYKTGDLGIAKMLEVLFRSTGEIANANFSATATANAVQNGVAEIDIYKPLWLRESEAKMLAESKQRILGPGTPPEAGEGRPLTPEKATEYVIAAKGNKDQARAAALRDGWTL
jgi:hypothetical protein